MKAHPDMNDTMREEGRDAVRARHDHARKFNGDGKSKQQPFALKPFDTITLSTARNYLVKGLLPRIGLAVVWGPPKCGKSFWTFDATMHVALGWEYRGRRVRQGPVVYLALEGGHGFRARVEAWRRRYLADHHDPVPFYLIDVLVDLVADHDKLIAAIREELGDQMPVAVVIDTLNRALIGDENKSDDMARFIRAADTVRAAFGCAVVIVHHCGVQGSRPRGHTSLSGADDAQIAIARDDDGNIIATVEHMKDSEAGAVFASRLEHVELGTDEDGDPITSCVIVPAVGAIASKGPKIKGANNQLALNLLRALIAESSQTPPEDGPIPKNARACSAVEWRERFYSTYPGKPDTKQKTFVRAMVKLQELDLIGLWSTWVWVPDKPDKSKN